MLHRASPMPWMGCPMCICRPKRSFHYYLGNKLHAVFKGINCCVTIVAASQSFWGAIKDKKRQKSHCTSCRGLRLWAESQDVNGGINTFVLFHNGLSFQSFFSATTRCESDLLFSAFCITSALIKRYRGLMCNLQVVFKFWIWLQCFYLFGIFLKYKIE